MSPVNTRRLLGRTDEYALSFATATGDIDPQTAGGFWAIARRANEISAPLRTASGFAGFLGALAGFAASKPSVDDALQLERQVFPIDFMISNLGVMPFPAKIGPFEIKTFFGPAMILGMEEEQMIGISSIESRIHLVHSSYSPISDLLEAVEARLMQAMG